MTSTLRSTPTETNLHSLKKERIAIIDILRGFAVMVIMLLHNIEHFNFYFFPDKAGQANWLNQLDQHLWDGMFFLFAGKTYSIFALLFGFTFYLMNHKQQQLGKDFGPRYLWRLLLLSGFACFNALFFPGEVLMLYAVTGISLYFVRNKSAKFILFTALVFLMQPVEWLLYLRSAFDSDFSLPAKLYAQYWQPVMDALHTDSFWTTISSNITNGQKFSMLWAIENGRFTQTIGLFLLGLYFGKSSLFKHSPSNIARWKRIFMGAAICCIPLYFAKNHFQQAELLAIKRTLGIVFDMWFKFSFTLIWVSIFMLLAENTTFKRITKPLTAYGRMSLTNYITQSIFGGVVYFGYGLYLAKYCGTSLSLLIGIAMLIVQITFCNWWLKHHRQGPFEQLWHRWTWIK